MTPLILALAALLAVLAVPAALQAAPPLAEARAAATSRVTAEAAPTLVAQITAPERPATALRAPDVVFVPTPQPVVDAMLRLAAVRKGDVLYDLGSGDGRIPITAAREYGVRTVGIDINRDRIREANANSRLAGTTALVTFRNEDLFEADISEATVVTLYLLSHLNEKLRPKLVRELRPGTRIVSHVFGMGDWTPERRVDIGIRSVYLWTVPPRPAADGEAGGGATRP